MNEIDAMLDSNFTLPNAVLSSVAERFLALMMPPLELINKLEGTPNLPESIKVWRNRMMDIRSDGPSDIDDVDLEVYQQALFIVEEKMKKVRVY